MEAIDFDRSIIGLLVDLTNMKKAHNLGLKKYHIVGLTEQAIYEFQYDYWTASNRSKVASKEVIFTEFKYTVSEVKESIEYIVGGLTERYRRNIIQDNLIEIANISYDDSKAAARKMFEVSANALRYTEPRVNKTDMSTSIDERRLRYDKRANFAGMVRSAPLGFTEIDEHTGGIQPGQLAIWAGFAKAGKSMGLAHAAIAAKKAGWKPYIATLEISTAEFEDRIDAINSGVCLKRLLNGQLDKDELKSLHEAQEDFAQYGPLQLEKLPEGDRTIKFICNRAREMESDFLIIDQLSHLETSKSIRGISETERYGMILPELTANISEQEDEMLPVLLAAQFNRESKKKGNEIGMWNLAGSSYIEKYATIIYGLERSKEMEMNNMMNLHILGSRHTESGSWSLEWRLRGKTKFEVLGELSSLL